MSKLSAVALLALALLVAVPSHAQSTESTINVVAPHGCGRSSYPMYCYGVPVDVGGTFWLDNYYLAQKGPIYNNGYGFILFNGVADLGQEATITGSTITSTVVVGRYGTHISGLTITFSGTTPEGVAYTGVGTFAFTYYIGSCSGRGCGIPVSFSISSGVLDITYN